MLHVFGLYLTSIQPNYNTSLMSVVTTLDYVLLSLRVILWCSHGDLIDSHLFSYNQNQSIFF